MSIAELARHYRFRSHKVEPNRQDGMFGFYTLVLPNGVPGEETRINIMAFAGRNAFGEHYNVRANNAGQDTLTLDVRNVDILDRLLSVYIENFYLGSGRFVPVESRHSVRN